MARSNNGSSFVGKLSSKTEWNLAFAIAFVVAVLAYIRIYFGVSVGDEAHYPSIAYLPLVGGHWFKEESIIQQTAAILLSPAVIVYGKLFGSSGLMLFTRHLFFLMSLATAYSLYSLLRSLARPPIAILIAACAIAFVPNAIASMNYNTMGSHFFGMATAWGLNSIIRNDKRMAIASAILWVLCGFSYAPFVIPFVFFSLAYFVFISKVPEVKRNLLWPFVVSVSVTSILLLGVLLVVGIENIMAAIKYSALFNAPGGLWKLPMAYDLMWKYLPPSYVVFGVIALWIYLAKTNIVLAPLGLAFFVGSFVFLGGKYEAMPSQTLWAIISLLLIVHFAIGRMPKEKWFWHTCFLIVLPAIVGSLVACLSSRLTLYVMCLSGFFGSVAAVALIIGQNRRAGWLSLGLLVGLSLYNYYETVYEDEKLSELDYTIHTGPFKGLRTFQEKGEMIESIERDLIATGLHQKRILFKDLFPAGYTMSDNIPSGPSLYFGPAIFYPEARPVYAKIFSKTEMLPDIVVELAYYPVNKKSKWPYTVSYPGMRPDPFAHFFKDSGSYEILLEKPTHRILVKK